MTAGVRLHTFTPDARGRAPWPALRRGRTFELRHPTIDRMHLRRTYRTARRSGVPADMARYLILEAAEVFAERAA